MISQIFVDNHPIFEDREIQEKERFQWAYRTVNALHWETDAAFIREELLFDEGECFRSMLLEESERILRQYPFIGHAEIFSILQSDGSRHVVVDTKDDWTTSVGIETGDGILDVQGGGIEEENLLGRGIFVEASYEQTDFATEWGARVETPRFLSTRWDLSLEAGERRGGGYWSQELVFPFLGQVGRKGARQRIAERETLFNFEVPRGSRPYERVLLPLRDRSAELTFAGRLGPPGNLTTVGVGFSREELSFPGYPGALVVQRPEDGGAFSPADELAIDEVAPLISPGSRTRFNFILGQRNVRFVQRRGLDALRGEQDVQIGTDFAAVLGRSVRTEGENELGRADDLYARTEFQIGLAPGRFVLALNGSVEGRRVTADADSLDGWRDLLADLDFLAYWQPEALDGHTLFLRVGGTGGWSVVVPYQLTLGGSDRVRGFRDERFPGGRRLIVSLEDRIYVPWPRPELFDFGLTAFADAGRMWAGEAPFGIDTDVEASVGLGLRVGFPQGTGSVARIDVAYPVTGDGGFVFRAHFDEVLGLLAGMLDEQLLRTRRVGLGNERVTLPTQGRPGWGFR